MFDDLLDFYECVWNDLNWLGRVTLFPLMCLVAPVVFLVVLCVRR
jgi:hypothetical protein